MPVGLLLPELHQALLAATQKNYEMGKITYEKTGEAEPIFNIYGYSDFSNPGKRMTDQTINGIGSISKQFTAATFMKIWDEEITKVKQEQTSTASTELYFKKGLETHFSGFLPLLENKYTDCQKVFKQFRENNPNFDNITLRHLLNHTHGLGSRNGEILAQLMHEQPDRPLTLSEIIATTVKPKSEEFDQHFYSNVGYDLIAMIIEVITQKDFDLVVKEKILEPFRLSNTYTQSDHINLYSSAKRDISRGFYFNDYNKDFETNFNTRSNTRAAGGFKSTVEDLSKFSMLFLGGKTSENNEIMFENEEVRNAINEKEKGVFLYEILDGERKAIVGVRPSMKNDDAYHLGMTINSDGSIGHPGVDCDFLANMRFYPKEDKVKISLSVVENLSPQICRTHFEKNNPEILTTIKEFWELVISTKLKENNEPEVGSEQWVEVINQELSLDINSKYFAALNEFALLQQQVLSETRSDLISRYNPKPQISLSTPSAAAVNTNERSHLITG